MQDINTGSKDDEIFIFLDESGKFHPNHVSRYFAVGGFYCRRKEMPRIKNRYKKLNAKMKRAKGLEQNVEIKARDCMTNEEKIALIKEAESNSSFCGCGFVYKKSNLNLSKFDETYAFNYAVLKIVQKLISADKSTLGIKKISIICDNQNLKEERKKDLAKFFNTFFYLDGIEFDVTYVDSSSNYLVQLADLLVNTYYLEKKDSNLIKPVTESMDKSKHSVWSYPESSSSIE